MISNRRSRRSNGVAVEAEKEASISLKVAVNFEAAGDLDVAASVYFSKEH